MGRIDLAMMGGGPWLAFLSLLFGGLAGADSPPRFNHGTGPVLALPFNEAHRSAISCKECHGKIWDEWRQSRHRMAWSNSMFQNGLKEEPIKDRCVFCHAPRQEQYGEFRSGKQDLLGDGIDCLSCHVRAGAAYSSTGESFAHEVRLTPFLQRPEFCAGCHEFSFGQGPGQSSNASLTQSTYSEWLAYQRRGGRKTCIQCHMPGGSHGFWGAHSEARLKESLQVKASSKDGQSIRFELRSVNVGHGFPSGDLFRHLTLEIQEKGSDRFRKIATFGRNFRQVRDSRGLAHMRLERDNALQPFSPTIYKYKGPKKVLRYRVIYHYMKYAFGLTPEDDGFPEVLVEAEI